MPKLRKLLCKLVFVLFLFEAGACKKFVQISPPTTEIVTSDVFSNPNAATSAQTGIYSGMENHSEGYNISVEAGMLADELTNFSTVTMYREYYANAMESKDIGQPWTDAYNYIYQANAVISGLRISQGIATSIVQQLQGEAEFIRAFWYFYLTELYGAIPLPTTPSYSVNALLARTSQQQVYQQIINDLKNAESLLSSNYVDATDTAVTKDRIRPTKWAAAALLARTYLFAGSYDSSEEQASLAINNTSLYSLCGLDSVFLADSKEAIWQIPPVEPSSNLATPDGRYFILITAPQTGSNNNATISPQLMNAFELGDNRKTYWINSYKSGSNYYNFPYKYKAYSVASTSSISEYTMVLRLGEQYLIRAEARAQQGNLSGAMSDLNVIRNRAGLANYGGSMDQATILTAILHERQVELFTEWGTRWLDLQRTNTINNVMGVVTPQKGGTWSPSSSLLPIPLNEINVDPNLTQNPNY